MFALDLQPRSVPRVGRSCTVRWPSPPLYERASPSRTRPVRSKADNGRQRQLPDRFRECPAASRPASPPSPASAPLSSPGGLAPTVSQEALRRLDELGEFDLDGSPDNVPAHLMIGVNQADPGRGNSRPRHLRHQSASVRSEPASRLANNLHPLDLGEEEILVGIKIRPSAPGSLLHGCPSPV